MEPKTPQNNPLHLGLPQFCDEAGPVLQELFPFPTVAEVRRPRGLHVPDHDPEVRAQEGRGGGQEALEAGQFQGLVFWGGSARVYFESD